MDFEKKIEKRKIIKYFPAQGQKYQASKTGPILKYPPRYLRIHYAPNSWRENCTIFTGAQNRVVIVVFFLLFFFTPFLPSLSYQSFSAMSSFCNQIEEIKSLIYSNKSLAYSTLSHLQEQSVNDPSLLQTLADNSQDLVSLITVDISIDDEEV